MDSTTNLSKVFTRLKPRIDLHFRNTVKTTEMSFFSYIRKTEVSEEETNWLLETKDVILMDDKAEVLFHFYFTCQIEKRKITMSEKKS